MNLGIHLTFLPTLTHEIPTPKRVEPSMSAFSQMLGMDDLERNPTYWPFGADEAEAQQSISELVNTYVTKGTAFFDRWSRWPEDFVTIGADGIDRDRFPYLPPFRYPNTVFERARTLAHLHEHLGDHARAEAFARRGLQDAPPPDPRRDGLARFIRDHPQVG